MGTIEKHSVNLESMSYKKDRQPPYADLPKVKEAQGVLGFIEGATNGKNVAKLRGLFGRKQVGKLNQPVIVVRPCVGDIPEDGNIQEVVEGIKALIGVVNGSVSDALVLTGNGSEKPRSSETEITKSGEVVFTYMGDSVNSVDETCRQPDPERMIVAAMQAHDVHYALDYQNGEHVFSTQEVLLLPAIEAMKRETVNNGTYLASTDFPWIGERTRDPSGEHVEQLRHIRNPIGVKIGPEASEKDIKRLSRRLDPSLEPGKLVFILRIGLDKVQNAPKILDAIATHAPNSLILCDPMHGNTIKLEDDIKTRVVDDVIDEVKQISALCEHKGLRLHGLHLEAKDMGSDKECVDVRNEQPTRKSKIDPQLNLDQLARVLQETKEYLH